MKPLHLLFAGHEAVDDAHKEMHWPLADGVELGRAEYSCI